MRYRHDHMLGLDFQSVDDLREALDRAARPCVTDTLTIPACFNGPPTSANGGYTCGRVAQFVDAEVAEVSLRSPPPLDTPLARRARRTSACDRRDGDTLVAEGKPARAAAGRARRRSGRRGRGRAGGGARALVGGTPLPHVPRLRARARPDGLRIFPAKLPDREDLFGAAWTPDESLGDGDGLVRPELVWAALDCPTSAPVGNWNAGPAIVLAEPHRPARLPGAGGRAAHDPVLEARPGRAQALGRRRAVRLVRHLHVRVASPLDRARRSSVRAHGHALPDLSILRSHVRSRDRDRGTGGGVGPRRRGGRLQPRLHLPEGVRDQAAPRGPGPADHAAGAPRRRAGGGHLGRGVRGDRPAAHADPLRARPQRRRGLPRQPERPQPVVAITYGPALLRVLGSQNIYTASTVDQMPKQVSRRAHVRHDAVGAGPGRGPHATTC